LRQLASILNTTGQVNEHINIHQKWHEPKNQKQIYCFYAAPRAEEPKGSNAGIFQENDVGPFWLNEREREMNNITIK
jgi:hypothetical protein